MKSRFPIVALLLLALGTASVRPVKGEPTDELNLLPLPPTGPSPQGAERSRTVTNEPAEKSSSYRSHSNVPNPAHMMRIPTLVHMMSNFNFTDLIHLNTNTLRGGFDPLIDFSMTEPLWPKSLKRLEKFVAVTNDLKELCQEITALFDGNIKIMQDMVHHTNTNFVGFYN